MYNILIVDDEEMIRKLIRKYAEFEGHTVTEATDGMDAVIKFKNGSFDIIIMDIMMPELDGFSASREIRKTSNVPIIMLSARGEEYDKINGFEIGIDDYVVKPFSPKELMARIKVVIKRNAKSPDELKTGRYIFEGLEVDIAGREVYENGEKALFSLLKNVNSTNNSVSMFESSWTIPVFSAPSCDMFCKAFCTKVIEYITAFLYFSKRAWFCGFVKVIPNALICSSKI